MVAPACALQHDVCPPLGDEWEREYDPSELFPSERWIVNVSPPKTRHIVFYFRQMRYLHFLIFNCAWK